MRHILLAKGELRLARLGAEAEVIENVALQSAFATNSKVRTYDEQTHTTHTHKCNTDAHRHAHTQPRT